MLRFAVFSEGQPAPSVDLTGAYLVGSDGVPLRADIEFRRGEIICRKRAAGPGGLVLLWPVPGCGRLLMETTRLPERDEPYNLHVELVRSRLMRISQKREDWGLFDYAGVESLSQKVNESRDLLIEALQSDRPAAAAGLADKALALSVDTSEQLSLFHAEVFLARRKQTGGFTRRLFGCDIDPRQTDEAYRRLLARAFDFAAIPFSWRQIEPREQEFNWKELDNWVEWLNKNRLPMRGAGLVNFAEQHVPDWLYIWEHDFETVRDLVYEHVRRVINRYGQHVKVWDVISGIHAAQNFSFNFEQLMELTRMATAITKQLAPRSVTIVDLVAPWGEYYARNQRTIPPMLYAEMAVQSGINFDAFGLQFHFGGASETSMARDLFQVSSMIDRFSSMGKPLHITAVGVPSGVPAAERALAAKAGYWHEDWSESTQSRWLRAFYEIALSKPFVDTVTWRDLCDNDRSPVPMGGLVRPDLNPKPAYNDLIALRNEILGNRVNEPAA